VKMLFSVIFTGRIFPGFSSDDNEDIPKTGDNPDEQEYEKEQVSRSEPLVEFQTDQNADEDCQHDGDADAGKNAERF